MPIRVPRVYAVAQRGARFVLLLENLRELPGVKLFINRDMAAGTTPDRARLCLSAFAELHAAFHGFSQQRREALLPVALHPFLPRAAARHHAGAERCGDRARPGAKRQTSFRRRSPRCAAAPSRAGMR